MFLEHIVVLTCLYRQSPLQSYLQNVAMHQPGVEYFEQQQGGGGTSCLAVNL